MEDLCLSLEIDANRSPNSTRGYLARMIERAELEQFDPERCVAAFLRWCSSPEGTKRFRGADSILAVALKNGPFDKWIEHQIEKRARRTVTDDEPADSPDNRDAWAELHDALKRHESDQSDQAAE